MALEDILAALEPEAEQACRNILSRARAEVEEIHARARRKAAEIKAEQIAQAKAKLAVEEAKIIRRARVSARRKVLEAKKEVIEEIFSLVEKRLKAVQRESSYNKVITLLAQELIKQINSRDLGSEIVVINGPKNCQASVEKLLPSSENWQFKVDDSINDGIKARLDSGKIQALNTLTSRLRALESNLKPSFSHFLFDHE
jgi:vacuolar-type H+-ATPase subunit E/Vma4